MSIFKNIALAIALSSAAILPAAAAEGITTDGSSYSQNRSQGVSPSRPAASQRSTRSLFLQDRGFTAPRAATPARRESAPGFGG